MKREIEIDGTRILSEEQFHTEIAKALDFPDYYGNNLDALWDCLSGHIDTDIRLVWKDHLSSKSALGDRFETIKGIFDELCKEENCFEFDLC